MRDVAGQYIIMPTGDNYSVFGGTIILNTLAAFIWQKLEIGATHEQLLDDILNEFDVSRVVAEKDLDSLLLKLREYDVIEDA